MEIPPEEKAEISSTIEVKDTISCVYCYEQIDPKAIKCKHCGEFPGRTFKGKPYGHWLGLIIVPATLVLLSGLLALFQSLIQNDIEGDRIAANSTIEADRIEADSTVEANRANASLLQAYLEDVTAILLNETTSSPVTRGAIRARTFTTMSELDGARNENLVRFLREAGLLDWIFWDAKLQGADLRGINLYSTHLNGADLREADLRDAILIGAHLEGAHLEGAHLEGADLIGADLSGAYLEGAYLKGAQYNIDSTEWPSDFNPKAAGAIPVVFVSP